MRVEKNPAVVKLCGCRHPGVLGFLVFGSERPIEADTVRFAGLLGSKAVERVYD